jgi:hypothetical protein
MAIFIRAVLAMCCVTAQTPFWHTLQGVSPMPSDIRGGEIGERQTHGILAASSAVTEDLPASSDPTVSDTEDWDYMQLGVTFAVVVTVTLLLLLIRWIWRL